MYPKGSKNRKNIVQCLRDGEITLDPIKEKNRRHRNENIKKVEEK